MISSQPVSGFLPSTVDNMAYPERTGAARLPCGCRGSDLQAASQRDRQSLSVRHAGTFKRTAFQMTERALQYHATKSNLDLALFDSYCTSESVGAVQSEVSLTYLKVLRRACMTKQMLSLKQPLSNRKQWPLLQPQHQNTLLQH